MDDREIAPTGTRFDVPQFGIYRIENGLIAEAWLLPDARGIVSQFGDFPSSPWKMLSIALRQLRGGLGSKKRVE